MVRTGIYYNTETEYPISEIQKEIPELKFVGYFSDFQDVKANIQIEKFENYTDFLSAIDALLIFSDTILTNDIIIALKNLKHVFFINSQSASLTDLRNFHKLANEAKTHIHPSVALNYKNTIETAKPFIKKPNYIETNYCKNFNTEKCNTNMIFNMIFEDIYSVLTIHNTRIKKIYPTFSCFNQQQAQILNVRIEFYNGLVANMTASTITKKEEHELKIYDNNKLINIDFIKNSTHLISYREKYVTPSLFSESFGNLLVLEIPEQSENQLKKEIKHFAHSIINHSLSNNLLDILINANSIRHNF